MREIIPYNTTHVLTPVCVPPTTNSFIEVNKMRNTKILATTPNTTKIHPDTIEVLMTTRISVYRQIFNTNHILQYPCAMYSPIRFIYSDLGKYMNNLPSTGEGMRSPLNFGLSCSSSSNPTIPHFIACLHGYVGRDLGKYMIHK